MILPITLFNALDEMNLADADGTPIPFDITFVTGNLAGKAGAGRVIRLKKVYLAKFKKELPQGLRKEYTPVAAAEIKEPRLRNSIKRLWIEKTQEIKNCNIRLIIEFNGREIIWHGND
jgi:hypothetical protein